MILMDKAMPRCRSCPRCGSANSRSVGRNFRAGTWRQCLICGVQFRPPVSLLTAGASLLFGAAALCLTALFVSVRVDAVLIAVVAAMGAVFTAWGVWMIVRYAKTPVGPLSGFQVEPSPQE